MSLPDYKAVCERSGGIYNASDMRQEWNGRWVYKKFWEPRHPGDTQVVPGDNLRPSWTRPVPVADTYQTRTVWPVTADPDTGYAQTGAFSVSLKSMTDDAVIRYTTNGSTPSATVGTVYAGPFEVGSTSTVKAIAYLATGETSTVASFAYTVN